MKNGISILLALCLVLGLVSSASAEGEDWAAAYAPILDAKGEEAAANELGFGDSFDYYYTLYDIDKDGVPELIVKLGTCEADFHGEIYTCREGKALCVCEDLGLGHSSFYSDPGENGIVRMGAHMGYAWAERLRLEGDGIVGEELYEDDLNARLQTDPEADYVYPEAYIPGSAYLSLYRTAQRLPLSRQEEIQACLEGRFPGTVACGTYPEDDPDFFDRLMAENGEVVAVSADGYTNSPGRIGFQDLLRQNVAADWMDSDLTVRSAQLADLNGDGQPECVVTLSQGGTGNEMSCYLSEQDGTVYAYLENYTDGVSADENGNLYRDAGYYQALHRLFFDREEAFLLTLPTACYAPLS